ncbi:MAG TPA: cytochrome c [Acetobacteraceae bacterium]|nr:cytochrome c [Acetobacteraceae bacterium]
MQHAIVLLAVATLVAGPIVVHRPRAEQAPPTRAQFEEGSQLFAQICSHCHGPKMVNPGTVSFDLRKFPHDDAARFFNSVRNGKNNMPPWRDVLKPNEIEAIWAYVRTGGEPP